jgi:hypothetical protein
MEAPFKSCREYLSFLHSHDSNFKWLQNFFTYVPSEITSHAVIIDSVGGKLFQPLVTKGLLRSRPKRVSTRIIVLSYDDIWTLDRDTLDDICYGLDLDPIFLWRHFDDDFSHLESPVDQLSKLRREPRFQKLPPSEVLSLDIATDYYNHERMSVLIVNSPGSLTFTNGMYLAFSENYPRTIILMKFQKLFYFARCPRKHIPLHSA